MDLFVSFMKVRVEVMKWIVFIESEKRVEEEILCNVCIWEEVEEDE